MSVTGDDGKKPATGEGSGAHITLKVNEQGAGWGGAKLANQLYQKKFSGPRWEALVKKGAKKQRLLWASTSVKNPAYPDTLYRSSAMLDKAHCCVGQKIMRRLAQM
ncbi:hypothetical protein E2562_004053 [Oryza meyeriana var. granulata]|uniref:Uncharacterized protein n=1 Tax=Oryza meyeriana var. granulata TaxID=110450 RepID=A0A6G1BJ25_9ORYZ|nr:hypothetical protein E2562_004053 [Oryza meyeriana var. granulata]KAF0887842.1 hypothetical protein E2562_004053 [Oryza meyeriana var. granulata]